MLGACKDFSINKVKSYPRRVRPTHMCDCENPSFPLSLSLPHSPLIFWSAAASYFVYCYKANSSTLVTPIHWPLSEDSERMTEKNDVAIVKLHICYIFFFKCSSLFTNLIAQQFNAHNSMEYVRLQPRKCP